MNVLVMCEESQRVCCAFRKLGHNAFSCDLRAPSGGHPEWHIQGDCLKYMNSEKWDLVIAHPPCTFLSKAGATSLFHDGVRDPDRWNKVLAAQSFFMTIYNDCDAPRLAIENPIPFRGLLPPPDQIIQPYFFGDPYTKATCLWLRGLPDLVADDLIPPYNGSFVYSKFRMSPVERSKTFPGIARAMAEQWSIPKIFGQYTFF